MSTYLRLLWLCQEWRTAAELVELLEITHGAVHCRLSRAIRDGDIEEKPAPYSGRGRPAKLYRARYRIQEVEQ